MRTRLFTIALVAGFACAAPAFSQSYYTARLDDPKAVFLDAFGARGDGIADDTEAIQQAIDKVQETVVQGIVFVPEGRYRLTRTVHVWPSIRLIGFGAHRPVFLLAPGTPGYQDRLAENYTVFFAGSRPPAPSACVARTRSTRSSPTWSSARARASPASTTRAT